MILVDISDTVMTGHAGNTGENLNILSLTHHRAYRMVELLLCHTVHSQTELTTMIKYPVAE